MAATPKRKISTMRKGKRMKAKVERLPEIQYCKNCNQPKLPHFVCKACEQ
ncbi:MAG: hypothetical protein KatS3mg090_0527 [Patescibacteria group bacterium]|nr:MAG: hypothetical protein KatS3mg090_0527 [Patescibacteria group bacterium]